MKRILALLASIAVVALSAGCAHGQHPVTPPLAPTCPPAGSYADLNGATGSASTSFTATNVTGQTCFEAQAYLNGQYAGATNIVGPTIGGATNKVALSVSCTVPNPNPNNFTCNVNWVFQSATAVVPLAPAQGSMGSPTTSQMVKPALPDTNAVGHLALTAKLEPRR